MNTDGTDGHGSESVKTRAIRVHPCPIPNSTRMNTDGTDGHGSESVKTRIIRVHPCPILSILTVDKRNAP